MALSFDEQLHASTQAVREEVCAVLRVIDVTGALETYGGSLGLYLKVPFMLACHTDDLDLRNKVAAILALHLVGVKFIDDLIDGDAPLSNCELGCASLHLMAEAEARMVALDSRNHARILLANEMATFARGQILTKVKPATDLASWCAYAGKYGGGFLRIYGRLGALLSNQPDLEPAVGQFAFTFGMMITIADDFTDYVRDGERIGNIGHLIALGAVASGQIVAMMDRLRRACERSVNGHRMETALTALAHKVADDVVMRILPKHLAIVEMSRS